MRVLVACEFSGTVRDAFLARGHDAVSCDLLPTEIPGPHVEGDAGIAAAMADQWGERLMRIINLTDEDLPALQGVETAPDAMLDACLNALHDGNPAGVRAGRVRSAVQTAAFQAQIEGDASLVGAINREEPWLAVLPRDEAEVARELCAMQVGPEPGTSIPLIVPVEARNRQWTFAGTKSDLRLPIIFEVDQSGDVVGMVNFVHRTPPLYGAQIDPEG